MHIKRNIKKFTHTQANKPITHKPLVSHNYGEYVIPTCDKVRPGIYHSKLVHAEYTTTKKGEEAIMALYDMKHGDTIFYIMKGALPKDTEVETYKFKQIYPEGSTYYQAFSDAMAKCFNIPINKEFSLEDIIGAEEYVKLGFNDYNDIGGIVYRCPMSWEDFLKECRRQAKKSQVYDDTDEGEYDDDYEDEPLVEEGNVEAAEETLPPSNDNAPSEDSVYDTEEEPAIEEKPDNKRATPGSKRRPGGLLGTRRSLTNKEPSKKEHLPVNTDDDEFDDFLDDEDDSYDW